MTDQEIIEVVQAHAAGKTIQYRNKRCSKRWDDCANNDPSWDFMLTDYRVKPEPCTIWVVTYNDGSMATKLREQDALESQRRWTNRATGQKPTITKFVEVID